MLDGLPLGAPGWGPEGPGWGLQPQVLVWICWVPCGLRVKSAAQELMVSLGLAKGRPETEPGRPRRAARGTGER